MKIIDSCSILYDTYQDVNQQQVLGVATLGVQQVLHAEFCWIRCETTAVPVQTVTDLQQQTNNTQKVSHECCC